MPPFGASSGEWDVNDQGDNSAGVYMVAALRDDFDEPSRDGKSYNPCRSPYYWCEFDSKGLLEKAYRGHVCTGPDSRVLVWDKNITTLTDADQPLAGAKLTFMRVYIDGPMCDDAESCPESSIPGSGSCIPEEKDRFQKIGLEFDSLGLLMSVEECDAEVWHKDAGAANQAEVASSLAGIESAASNTGVAGVIVRLTAIVDRVRQSSIHQRGPVESASCSDSTDPCDPCCHELDQRVGNCDEKLELCHIFLEFDSLGILVNLRKEPYRTLYPCGTPTVCCPDGLPDKLRLTFKAVNTSVAKGITWDICLIRAPCDKNRWSASVMLGYDSDCDGECDFHLHEFDFVCESNADPESGEANCEFVLYWNGNRNDTKVFDQCCPPFWVFIPISSGTDDDIMIPGCITPTEYSGDVTSATCLPCLQVFECAAPVSASSVPVGSSEIILP